MKYFYLIILTLFTITHSDATALAVTAEDETYGKIVRSSRPSTPGSEAGSYAGSRMSAASTILASHTPYDSAGVKITDAESLLVEYRKLTASYNDLLKVTSKTDTQFAQLVQGLERVLPDVVRSEAGENDLVVLQRGFSKLTGMYSHLKRRYDTSTGKVADSAATIADLKAGQEELQALMATMAPRPTEFAGTDMSPARVKAVREADAEGSKVVRDLRAALEAAVFERDAAGAERDAAIRRADAEKARADAAERVAASAFSGTTRRGSVNDKTPLLRGEEGYTPLNDDEAPARPAGGAQRKAPTGEDKQSCPCVVM